MHLYLAAVWTNGYHKTQNRYVKLNEGEQAIIDSIPYELDSYHYINKQSFVDTIRAQNGKIFLDSGAFSAHSLGVSIDINAYCDYIKRNRDILRCEDGAVMASVLDGIGDALKTYQNQLYMESQGAKPLPCFHFGEDPRYLEYYVANYSYITIGGLVGKAQRDQEVWLDRVWNDHMLDGSGNAKLKVHAFGMTAPHLMKRYPWHCMTEENHTVLTKSGWKSLCELTVGQDILCFDKGASFWSPILSIPTFNVQEAPIVNLESKNFSAFVSMNHRWIVQQKYTKEWDVHQTKDLLKIDLIPRSGIYQAPQIPIFSDYFVELAGWFWTDGTIKKRKHRGYKKDSVVIYQSMSANPEKVIRIRNTLVSSGEKYCESSTINKKGRIEISFELYGEIRDQLLEHFDELKTISYEWLLRLTKSQLDLFIECSVLGDGTKSPLVGETGFVLAQKYKENAERFRFACILAGQTTTQQNNLNNGMTSIANSNKNHIYLDELTIEPIYYTGTLWCVKVESGAFFTKCKEKVYVTGNSVDSSSWIQAAAFGSIFTSEHGPIAVSENSPSRHENGRHLTTLTDFERQSVECMLHGKGFNLERLSTVYESRACYNTLGYMELNKQINDHIQRVGGVLDVQKVQQLF